MQRATIQKIIFLDAKYMDENYLTHLSEKINTQFTGKCDGNCYITKIYPEITIISNDIASVGCGVYFTVTFDVELLKPTVGEVYTGKVAMVSKKGIFVEITKDFRILVSPNRLKDFTFTTNAFTKGNLTIEKGNIVKVVLELFRYERKNFSCLGNLKI